MEGEAASVPVVLCGDPGEALRAGVQEGKNLRHVLEDHTAWGPILPRQGVRAAWPRRRCCPGTAEENKGENAFASPSASAAPAACGAMLCPALSAASSSGPCARALFTFGLPDESLEGAGAAALFSLEQ